MSEATGDEHVAINQRTLRIGRQTYALNNIARVQVIGVKKPDNAGKGNTRLVCLSAVVVFILFSVLTAAGQTPGIALLGFLLAIIVGVVVYLMSRRDYTPRYALMLETTGNPMTGLVSPDRDGLEWISQRIIDAIENPPETEQVYTVSNVILGDQYNQHGNYNAGKVVNP